MVWTRIVAVHSRESAEARQRLLKQHFPYVKTRIRKVKNDFLGECYVLEHNYLGKQKFFY